MRLEAAKKFIDRVGLALVFPDARTPLPSLWGAVQGDPLRPMRVGDWDWTPEVENAWDLKDALGERRLVWFGKLVRGRATLASLEMLGPLCRLVGARRAETPEGRRICRTLEYVGPMSTYRLRTRMLMDASRFASILLGLYRKLLIANVGVDERDTRWPAAKVGLFAACYPAALRAAAELARAEAWRRVSAKAPTLKPAALGLSHEAPRLQEKVGGSRRPPRR